MSDEAEKPDTEWERGWDGHARAQARRLARLPLCDKIQWLEEAQRVTDALGRSRAKALADPSRIKPLP